MAQSDAARDRGQKADDPFDLQRFLAAQEAVYKGVRGELRAGRKATHWMWFVFPQIGGLGYSSMSQRYAIRGRDEAAAYAAHPVLGERLRECTSIINALQGRTVHQVFGSPDDLKFHSSMTLFSECAAEAGVFRQALDKFFGGAGDPQTLARL
jgi:uncharacterized protein (DUF1810 family)